MGELEPYDSDEWPYTPSEPEPMSPEHARDELLCGLLREAIAAWRRGELLIFTYEDGRPMPVSRFALTRDWYERAREATGD